MFTIRDATPADLPALNAIRYADSPGVHVQRLEIARLGHLRYLVAEEEPGARHFESAWRLKLVGFGMLVFTRPPNWPDSLYPEHLPQVVDLYVPFARRSQGIGSALLHHMELLAAQAGCTHLYLCVDPRANLRAQALYQRLGYQVIGEPFPDDLRVIDAGEQTRVGSGWGVEMGKPLIPTITSSTSARKAG